MKAKTLKTAYNLMTQINAAYRSIDDNIIIQLYHDSMLCQKDGAEEYILQLEQCVKQKNYEEAREILKTLKDTLEYCQHIIAVQELIQKTPEPIFG